jgi:ribosomal protein S27E
MNKGKVMYVCMDCGCRQLLWPWLFGRGVTQRVRCRQCCSTFIEPASKAAQGAELDRSAVRAVTVQNSGPSRILRRLSHKRVITADDVRRKARRKPLDELAEEVRRA